MNMVGKTVVVTGASSGVGFETARQLAALGASIVMVCRDEVRGRRAAAQIAGSAAAAAPVVFRADLASQSEIHALSEDIHRRYDRVDVLVNNAGAMFDRRELTVDGIERTWAVNHLAPFLLTNLLLDRLAKAPRARVVTVASESHSGRLDFDNLQGERRYHFFGAYNRSKLANILFTYELARRVEGTAVTANCVSPGPTKTAFGANMHGLPALFPRVVKRIPFLLVDPSVGARMPVYVASSPDLDGVSGRFFLRGRQRRTRAISYDLEVAARLWRVSERLCEPAAVTLQRSRDGTLASA
jgi:retinol dehydrogenase 14